jgi:hypothetical protein
MKRNVYHAIIALGILSVGLSFWFTMAPAGRDEMTVDELRRLLREGASPEERALGAAGLGERRDVASMPQLLDAMAADSPVLRGQASVAVRKILGADYYFDPEASPSARQEVVGRYRSLWEAWQLKNNGVVEPPTAGLAGARGGP